MLQIVTENLFTKWAYKCDMIAKNNIYTKQ